jgi:hypothetical protein
VFLLGPIMHVMWFLFVAFLLAAMMDDGDAV